MLPEKVTTGDLRLLLGITPQAIGDLERRGVLKRVSRGTYDLRESVSAYCSHMREVAAGRKSEDEDVDLVKERALLAREQREGHAIKNAALKGELVEAGAVERRWASVLSGVRARMLGLPSDLAQTLPHLTRFDTETIDRAIRGALNDAADDFSGDA